MGAAKFFGGCRVPKAKKVENHWSTLCLLERIF